MFTILPTRAFLICLLVSEREEEDSDEDRNDENSSPPAPLLVEFWERSSGLSAKIREACRVAREAGFRYIWIDSSCIDKSSSSELQEAINSMYAWYRCAHICFAYLSDVPDDDNVAAKDSAFRRSRWFKQGWTL